MIIFSRQLPLIINHQFPPRGVVVLSLCRCSQFFLQYKLDDNISTDTFTYPNLTPHQSTVLRYAEEHVGLFYLQDPQEEGWCFGLSFQHAFGA